ncbi:MAG: ATP-binding cassette domain-containing protein [Burkholderiales bacterium]|nr:ATP-binding cassette domain-containing protein [Burkholderiales bacterium]MDE2159942.1 ATP-binding cassette domain-containing protein [Burkholderiales bacterium]MDE2504337.1 ATP-binding cassette domain-containing protein [Burkholderiales bacterium]
MLPNPEARAIAIEARDVTLYYRMSPVLNRVTLAIPEGAVVGLVGRNGAGKSTLLRCLVGLTAPHDDGRCSLLGSPSLDLPDTVRARLGYAAQTPDLYGWLDGHAHLQRLAALYPSYSELRALELAVSLDLPLGLRASRLSIGDQQKLSILLAMAHDPDLLILDEPVASLDPLARRQFMRALFERRDAGAAPRTVLVSSHLLTDLERVVSHIVFMREGRVQLADAWDAVAENLELLVLHRESDAETRAAGVLHRRQIGDEWRLVVDRRAVPPETPPGQRMNLDDLFAELNS